MYDYNYTFNYCHLTCSFKFKLHVVQYLIFNLKVLYPLECTTPGHAWPCCSCRKSTTDLSRDWTPWGHIQQIVHHLEGTAWMFRLFLGLPNLFFQTSGINFTSGRNIWMIVLTTLVLIKTLLTILQKFKPRNREHAISKKPLKWSIIHTIEYCCYHYHQ